MRLLPLRSLIFLFILSTGLLTGCDKADDLTLFEGDEVIERIQARDTLVAVTGYNPVSYFLYRGQPLGYEYELLQEFADELGVALDIKLEEDVNTMFEMVNNGEADLIAYRLTMTAERAEIIDFTDYIHLTRQVLVQGMPEEWDSMRVAQLNKDLVMYPFELIGDSIYVPEGSSYATRMENLAEEVGGEIDIIEVSANTSTETLIRRVAEGDIDYTVTNETIGLLNQAYYGNIAARPVMSLYQRIAWAVPKGADALRQRVNTWLAAFRETDRFQTIYDTYFEDRIGYKERAESEYLTSETGRLSDYDDLLRATADSLALGWDWRLLAAQMYQESRFDPRARSWAGAMGLMQLMPPTAREFGVSDAYDPENNVQGAVRFLLWLEAYWADKIEDETERTKFILASYNTGHGHVEDARRLTEKNGGDPNTWNDVADFLLKLSKRTFYQDPVVKYGYARGIEPVTYVERILERFEHYQRFVT